MTTDKQTLCGVSPLRKNASLIASLTILLLLTLAASGQPVAQANSSTAKSQEAYTPPKGSAERKAILDAYRAVWKGDGEITDVVFVVNHLKVRQGWAWLEVNPQSADASQQYEPEQGLLRMKNGEWQVLERTAGADAKYFRRLKAKYHGLPPDIFNVDERPAISSLSAFE